MKIRKYRSGDENSLWQLKVATIRNVNISDYSETEINAWAPEIYDSKRWLERVSTMDPFVAEIDGVIVGFADIQNDGYIDHFFCHHQFQRKGVGRALMQQLMNSGREKSVTRFYSHVSITAKPFFEKFGFKVEKVQPMKIGDQSIFNYVMEKHLSVL